ncbi:type 1 fimbrial protein [Aliivibrio fischeri]|uniref:type 1 fimbrial protein n=1 Tax=Aliivibrio fischeri TaxID=668 RepID=UPI0009BCB42A|nr:type 1 fimbrial protein [Aliivibrio fischeri]
MKKYYFVLLSAFCLPVAHATPEILLKSKLNIGGVVVGSACSVIVESGTSRNGRIDFGQYNQELRIGGSSKLFSVKLFENNAGVPGCSAFLAGSGLVSLAFGDTSSKQLDEKGVITRGAGGNVRIAISSTDTGKVSNQRIITANNSVLKYPQEFASKGVFGFNAKVEGLDSAAAGRYQGSLSLVVSYK